MSMTQQRVPDAADPDHLAGDLDEAVALQQVPAVVGQRVAVSPQVLVDRLFEVPALRFVVELLDRDEQGRIADEPGFAVHDGGQLGFGLEPVLGLGLGDRALEALEGIGAKCALVGRRGMGKSSLVKSAHAAINRGRMSRAPRAGRVRPRGHRGVAFPHRPHARRALRFIVFCDDLSSTRRHSYKSLKAALEGGIEASGERPFLCDLEPAPSSAARHDG